MKIKFNDLDETVMVSEDIIGFTRSWLVPTTMIVKTPMGIYIHLEHADYESYELDRKVLETLGFKEEFPEI